LCEIKIATGLVLVTNQFALKRYLARDSTADSIALIRAGEAVMDSSSEFKRDVLVSVRPPFAEKILTGEKTVELRRRFPRNGTIGAIALIYSSSPVRAIVAVARIKDVMKLPVSQIWKDHGAAACISKREFDSYFAGLKIGFVILLDSLRPLPNQLKAAELIAQFGIVPPQSYRYVTDECVSFASDEGLQASNRHKRRNRTGRPSARPSVSR
jgi:predicted transcriptional regulator